VTRATWPSSLLMPHSFQLRGGPCAPGLPAGGVYLAGLGCALSAGFDTPHKRTPEPRPASDTLARQGTGWPGRRPAEDRQIRPRSYAPARQPGPTWRSCPAGEEARVGLTNAGQARYRQIRFLIAHPSGECTDWLKSLLDKGSAAIVTNGHTYEVGRPEVSPWPRRPPTSAHGSSVCTGSSTWTLHSRSIGGQRLTDNRADWMPPKLPVICRSFCLAGLLAVRHAAYANILEPSPTLL